MRGGLPFEQFLLGDENAGGGTDDRVHGDESLVQKEYQVLSDSIDFENANYEEILTEADKLFVSGTAIEEKNRILLLLARLGTMESAKILEKYSKTSEGTLND